MQNAVTDVQLDGHQPTKRQPSGTPIVAAQDVSVEYGSGHRAIHALGPFSVDVHEGEFISIVGPSGCGKSTFIRVVAGITNPTMGRVDLTVPGGVCPISTVFQNFGIFPWKTVQANVEFGLRVLDVPAKEARTRARDWIIRMGLRDFCDEYPAALSGGMQQRVSIARALVVEPAVLLMDEPFASLDAQLREILQDELLTITQTDKRTILFVTHSLEEALLLSDRLVVMTARPGRLREDVVVPFERPRSFDIRESPEFQAMRLQLWESLKAEVEAQFRREDDDAGQDDAEA